MSNPRIIFFVLIVFATSVVAYFLYGLMGGGGFAEAFKNAITDTLGLRANKHFVAEFDLSEMEARSSVRATDTVVVEETGNGAVPLATVTADGKIVVVSDGGDVTSVVIHKERQESGSGKVFISEIFYNAKGGDEGREFIELHNISGSAVDVSGWSLRRDGNSLALIGVGAADKTMVPANGFFLIGLNGYSDVPSADVVRSAYLPNAGATVALIDSSGNTIDSVFYNNFVEAGSSWERAHFPDGEFVSRVNPNPQNSGE